MAMKIVILEDNEDRQAAMKRLLADRFHTFEAQFFANAFDVIQYLREHLSETIAISLDHDLEIQMSNGEAHDPGTGREVAEFLATQSPVCAVILATTNRPAAVAMETALREAGWHTRQIVPWNDLEWIAKDWFPAIRRAIVDAAREVRVNAIPSKA
jgi:CheY-like chemotaxis protein